MIGAIKLEPPVLCTAYWGKLNFRSEETTFHPR